jgi:hypothetical protein
MSEKQKNLDKLVDLVRVVLRSNGKTKSMDNDGYVFYINCDVYDRSMLETFVHLSLSNFNQIPHFTNYALDDSEFVDLFTEVLVEGVVIYALSSQALIERGREFQMIDNGITFDPPVLSELLNNQYTILLNHHFEKLKLIKKELREK